jgi:hypothetical protein
MGNCLSKFTPVLSNLDNNQIPDELRAIASSGLHEAEDPNSVGHAQATSSNTSYLCTICLRVLTDTTEYGATRYHSSLLSLEESARSGCHLCSLVRHFLPERPRHQLDEYLTLSLKWDGHWEGLLLAGWTHRVVAFNLVQLGSLTKFRKHERGHCALLLIEA